MPRRVCFEIPVDTSAFTPFQLHPRVVLKHTMEAWARWVEQHLVSFRSLVGEHKTGVVVMGIHLEYLETLQFFEADRYECEIDITALKDGNILRNNHRFGLGDTRVRAQLILRPVHISSVDEFSARPGPLPAELLNKFEPDEISQESVGRPVQDLLNRIQRDAKCIGELEHKFMMHRHMCEVAEQWSYIELPVHTEISRELLCHRHEDASQNLTALLGKPLQAFHAELYRPYFVYQDCIVQTKAYLLDDRHYFVHELHSEYSSDKPHALVIEVV